MKKLIFISTLIGVATVLSSCGKENAEKLYIYNWGDYIEESLIDDFENETGIDVIYETYASNEAMYQKIKSGGSNYDILIPSDYMIEKLVNEDMLQPLDYSLIPNYDYVLEDLKGMSFDPENQYTVPYMWGTVGIAYNKSLVDKPTSWSVLFDKSNSGEIFMYDSSRDLLMVGLKYLGYSMNTTNEAEIQDARDLLIAQKPLVQAYLDDSVKDKMIGEEGTYAVVYSGDAVYMSQENENIGYSVPDEGSNVWVDSLVIPKDAKNVLNAHTFINFIMEKENAKINSEYIGYTTTNSETLEIIDEALLNAEGYSVEVDMSKMEIYSDLGKAVSLYDRAFTEILAN
ncbi:MAG: PotD/PotF family extracellular solute-binding protein [Lachnospirales bacterium]